MTQTSAFHFESLVWDWPIAIYLFLIGISAGLVTLAVMLRRVYPQAGGADSTLLRTTLIVGPGAVILAVEWKRQPITISFRSVAEKFTSTQAVTALTPTEI